MHLDDERIQRFLDGELGPAAVGRVRAHVESCPACRATFGEAEAEQREVDALLSRLESPAMEVDPRRLLRGWERRGGRRRLAWAASILVALSVAGGVWAATGGSIPGWLRSLGGGSVPAPSDRVPALEETGAGIQARADGLRVDFPLADPGAELRVRLTDAPLVEVRSLRGEVVFTDRDEGRRLTVEPSGAGAVVRVDVPRDALRVEVRVGGRTVFLREAGRSETEAAPDTEGVWRFPLDEGGG